MTRKHPAQELEEDVLVRTSNMGQGRSDYEAFHTLSPAIHLREIHTHDFFELYIHLNGFPRLYVDNKIVTLQRGSLMIFPPFVMHGIISQDTIRNYERVVLFISSGMLHQLGQGLLPLEQVRTSNMGQGRSDYEAFHTLSPAIHLREIHTHDFFELYIHLNGFPRLYVDNKIVTLQRGSLMIFPPFVMHGIISQDTIRNYERVVLFISSGMLHQLGQGLLPLEQRLLDCTRRTGYHYQLDEAALSLCTTCIDRVAQNTGDERPESRLADYVAMTELLLQILRVTQEAPMLQSAQPSPDTIQRVMAYINEHYAQPLTLEEIADAFFISKSYLSHEFVRYTNTSVYEYIQFRRICGAKLLIASGVSLTDAAFQSGFNSYSSFLRTFRKTAGISPTDFQRNLGK